MNGARIARSRPSLRLLPLPSSRTSPTLPQWRDSLGQFGWQEGYLRQYSVDAQSADTAGWVEASAHRFATVSGAQRAVQYLAEQFSISSGFPASSVATTANVTFSYSGPGYNGNETAVFALEENFVIVVIGVAPSGSPDATVQAVIDSAVAAIGT